MKQRRHQLWIDAQRQSQFIRHLIAVALLSGGLTLISLYATVWFNFRILESVGLRSVPEIRSLFWTATLQLTLAFLVFQGLITVLIVFLGKRISHRITGPLFSLKRRLGTLRTGDLSSPFRIRKGDFLQELQQVFEQFRLFLLSNQERQKEDLITLKVFTGELHHQPTKAKLRAEWSKSDHEEAA